MRIAKSRVERMGGPMRDVRVVTPGRGKEQYPRQEFYGPCRDCREHKSSQASWTLQSVAPIQPTPQAMMVGEDSSMSTGEPPACLTWQRRR